MYRCPPSQKGLLSVLFHFLTMFNSRSKTKLQFNIVDFFAPSTFTRALAISHLLLTTSLFNAFFNRSFLCLPIHFHFQPSYFCFLQNQTPINATFTHHTLKGGLFVSFAHLFSTTELQNRFGLSSFKGKEFSSVCVWDTLWASSKSRGH